MAQEMILADSATRFGRYLYVVGWLHAPQGLLTSIEIVGVATAAQSFEVSLPYPGVSLAPNLGWRLHVLMGEADYPYDAIVRFQLNNGEVLERSLRDLTEELEGRSVNGAYRRFRELLVEERARTVLDVGGRNRSGLDRSKLYPGLDVKVVDILPGENVDVVGDAHELSRLFPAESFDAVTSTSVLEHLMVPWKVAIEINRILKPGGLCFVHTHQSIGLHDHPWDFWRVSSTAWPALFGPATGFEIIETTMSQPCYLFPLAWRAGKEGNENSVGFESSSVLVRKVGEPRVSWDVSLQDLTDTMYPHD
jgi:SAM-dependent methyltransferase